MNAAQAHGLLVFGLFLGLVRWALHVLFTAARALFAMLGGAQ